MISVINGYVFWERFYILIQKVRTGSLREKCPYLKLLWSPYSRIGTEYDEILRISPYSVLMRKMRTRITPNTDTFANWIIPSFHHILTLILLLALRTLDTAGFHILPVELSRDGFHSQQVCIFFFL